MMQARFTKIQEKNSIMSRTKRALLLLMIMAIMLGGCGLFNNPKYSTSAQTKLAKERLREKYGEEFELSAIGGRWGTGSNTTFTVIAYPVNNPELLFQAEISKEGTFMYDRYIDKILCTELKGSITSQISFDASFFVSCTLRDIKMNNTSITVNEAFEEKKVSSLTICMVCTNDTELSAKIEELNDILKTYPKLEGRIWCYVTDDKNIVDEFGKMADENITYVADMKHLLSDIKEQEFTINNGCIEY